VPDWTDPEPFEAKALHEALMFAYPRASDFDTFLQFNFGRSYYHLAAETANYRRGLLEVLLLARGEGWLEDIFTKARRHLPKSPKLLQLDRNLGLARPEGEQIGRRLEDIVRNEGHFQELMPWIDKLGKLGSQTCRIECPVNLPQGSGWLVGPDLVLTNWHVIEKILPGGPWNASDVVCRFDYVVTGAGAQPGTGVGLAENWCVDVSPASPSETGRGTQEPDADMLDYALIRLGTAVGTAPSPASPARGWVTLRGNELAPPDDAIVCVLQYPDGYPLKLSLGDVVKGPAHGFRFLHTADTRGGSSGSLVLDAACEPVGLHHAGDLNYHMGKIGKPETNQAVPIGLIADRLKARGHL